MNLPFFAVKAYVPGGARIRPKKIQKMPSGRYRYKNLLLGYFWICLSIAGLGVAGSLS